MSQLRDAADYFLKELKNAEENAKTESDFDVLEDVCEDVLSGIPITIMQKDYYKRSDIRTYLAPSENEDTEFISKVMNKLYMRDTISFSYDLVNQAIEDDLEDKLIWKSN